MINIIDIQPYSGYYIITDKETYRRNSANNWEQLYGDSWEQAYSDEKMLEEAYQEYISI